MTGACPQCGRRAGPGEAFCARCGARLAGFPQSAGLSPAATGARASRGGGRGAGARRRLTRWLMVGARIFGGLALSLWLYHIGDDAQLGSASASGLTGASSSAALSDLSMAMAGLARAALGLGLGLALAALLLSPLRGQLLRSLGRWLALLGAFGLLWSWLLPQLLAANLHSAAARSALLTGLLRTAVPMRTVYLTLAGLGVALYATGRAVMWLRARWRRHDRLELGAPPSSDP